MNKQQQQAYGKRGKWFPEGRGMGDEQRLVKGEKMGTSVLVSKIKIKKEEINKKAETEQKAFYLCYMWKE